MSRRCRSCNFPWLEPSWNAKCGTESEMRDMALLRASELSRRRQLEREMRDVAGAQLEREMRDMAGAQLEREMRDMAGAQLEREMRDIP